MVMTIIIARRVAALRKLVGEEMIMRCGTRRSRGKSFFTLERNKGVAIPVIS